MKAKINNTKTIQILGGVIWAALILLCAFLLKDLSINKLIINILTVAAGLQISLLGFFINKVVKKA